MDTIQIKSIFEKADQHFEIARNELNRPEEDIVSFMVCRNARSALSGYLEAYLLANGIKQEEGASPETLLSRCRSLHTKFNDFDLEALNFSEDEEYSASQQQMHSCINLALKAKQLVSE